MMVKKFKLPKVGSDTTKVFTRAEHGMPQNWPPGFYRNIGSGKYPVEEWNESCFMLVTARREAIYFGKSHDVPGVVPCEGTWNDDCYVPLPIGTELMIKIKDDNFP